MPERGLRGKIVLAIGCTDGMGFSAAKYIGMEGATIVVNSRREPNVTKAIKLSLFMSTARIKIYTPPQLTTDFL